MVFCFFLHFYIFAITLLPNLSLSQTTVSQLLTAVGCLAQNMEIVISIFLSIIKEDKVKCCYQQKKQTVAFLLECTFSFGTGHFYMGNFYLASLKFVVCLFLSCFISIFGFLHCYGEGEYSIEVTTHYKKTNLFPFYVFLISLILFIIGHVTDLLLIGINFYLDDKRQPLAEW